MSDEHIMCLEGIANTLRGMTFDRRIPEEARAVLAEKAVQIDAITEAALDEGSMDDD